LFRGHWLIELGEMAAVGKGDQKRTKQVITSQIDTFRESYGRRTQSYPRQCVFAATTNDDEPLKDDTGGRRWWILECRSPWFEKDYEIDVNQIWAEVMTVYREMNQNDIPLTLPKELEEEARNVQIEYTEQSVYAEKIEQILNDQGGFEYINYTSSGMGEPPYKSHPTTKIERIDLVCAKQLWIEGLHRNEDEFTSATGREIT